MIEKKYTNEEINIELTSFLDVKQNICFLGKEIATILGYCNISKCIWDRVPCEDKRIISWSSQTEPQVQARNYTIINESGLYSLILSSKLASAKRFKHWVTSKVLPSIRKHGYYMSFNKPWNKIIMIGNETDLHYKVVNLIRRYYPDSILVAGLGENQDTDDRRLDSYKKGYMRGQPDLMVLDYHKDYKGLCIEFKSPTNNYHVSKAQYVLMEKYSINNYKFILSNDYDEICIEVHDYMKGIRVPCKYCIKHFYNKDTLETHYRVIHRII